MARSSSDWLNPNCLTRLISAAIAADLALQAWSLVHLLGEKGRLKKEYLQMYVKELIAKKSAYDALPVLTGIPNDQTQKEMFEKLKYNFEK